MKRIILGSILSCMLIGRIHADNTQIIASAVLPTLAGASAGGIYALAKACYSHRRYQNYYDHASINTLICGAQIAAQYQNGGLTQHEPYMRPMASSMIDASLVGGLLGIVIGFYRAGFADGCKITLGPLAMALSTREAILSAHTYFAGALFRGDFGWRSSNRITTFTYPVPNP